MTILVTGGAGFIGTNLVRAFVERGDRVIVFDNLSASTGETLHDIADRIHFIRGDVRDRAELTEAVRGVDVILHHAAIRPVGVSIEQPVLVHDTNATGTLNVLTAARNQGVRRVVIASSSAVYGEAHRLPIHEDDPLRSVSPYALTKQMSEEYARLFAELYNLETISLRYFNVYGPYEQAESLYPLVLPIFLDQLNRGETPEIHGDGSQSRDFVFVGDVVQANVRAATQPEIGNGEVVNIGSGTRASVREIYNILQRLLKRQITPRTGVRRQGDVSHTQADITRARAILGYVPTVTLEEGIRRSIEWHRTHAYVPSSPRP